MLTADNESFSLALLEDPSSEATLKVSRGKKIPCYDKKVKKKHEKLATIV